MSNQKIVIPPFFYKMYRSKLSADLDQIKNKPSLFSNPSAQYIFKFPKTASDISIISAQDYFYDSFEIKGDIVIDSNDCHLNFIIHPLLKNQNQYEWNAAHFDYIESKNIDITNTHDAFVDISPIRYIIGTVPHYSKMPLETLNIQAKHVELKLNQVENLQNIKISLQDKPLYDNRVNYSVFFIDNCKKLKSIDFTKVGKNNYLSLYVDKKTNQDFILKFNNNQIFTPSTLATLIHAPHGFTYDYYNKYLICDLLDLKQKPEIVEVKYSDFVKKVSKNIQVY